MNDFDKRLRTLLEAEAAAVAPDGTRARGTLAGVRRRLLFRAAGAGLTACAVVMTAVVGADAALSALDRGAGQNAASAGPSPAHEGRAGVYPVIAEGTYEGRAWTLSVVEDPDAAHPEDTESENPEILFELEGSNGGAFETYGGWDVLPEPFFTSLDEGGYELLMGMVAGSVATVSVESDDGRGVAVPIYDGGDRPLEDTNYYLALFESDGIGDVVARDEDGRVLAARPLVEDPGPDLSEVECFRAGEAPPLEEERDPAAGYRDVGEGTFDGRRWTLEMIEHPDIAHPEDTESDNPEILFEMEGSDNGTSFETHEGWDTIDTPMRGRLEDTDFAMGMVATNVTSVTFEGDDGTTVEASLFDGAGLPGPEASYYVVFMPPGARGEVVARAVSGTVLGRATVEDAWSQEIDFDC